MLLPDWGVSSLLVTSARRAPPGRHQSRRRRPHRIFPTGHLACRLRCAAFSHRELRRQRQDVLHGEWRAGKLCRSRLRHRLHQDVGPMAVDDCGRVINPLLVDEQVRGGIVQGIGAVLFEECIYSDDANLLNGTMADYLVPMAAEMPDIVLDHVETPEPSTRLGAKGIGEGGLIGAMGSVWVAVNDALKPLGAKVRHQPFTPERILDALARRE